MFNVLEVAMYSPNFLGSFGDSLLALGKELKRTGNSMVLCFPERRDWMSVFEESGFCVEILPLRNILNESSVPRINHIQQASRNLCAFIRKHKIDIIHNHFWLESQIAVCTAKFLSPRDVKVVWHWRNSPRTDTLLLDDDEVRHRGAVKSSVTAKRRIGNVGYKFLDATCVSAHIAISRDISNTLQERGLRNIRVVHNGIDTDKYSPQVVQAVHEFPTSPGSSHFGASCKVAEGGICIGNVSNFRPQKDHRTFLESAKIMLKKYPGTRFVLVGDGSTRPEVEALGQRLGIADSLIFTGMQEDVRGIILACDFTVLSSLHEGFGNVICESMALGKPVVATDVGGIPEIVKDGENGFLVPRKNPGMMAEKMLYLIKHPKELTRLGQNGRELVKKKFTTQRWAERMSQVFSDL
jgi:glycosyltransferase involved in cell wall biosynthesis